MNRVIRGILTTLFLLTVISQSVFAGSAYPGPYDVDNGMGDSVQVMHYGNQDFIIETDMDGNLLTRDDKGILRYIIKSEDGGYSLGLSVSYNSGRAVDDKAVNRNTSDDETWSEAVELLKRDVSIFNSEDELIWFPQPDTDPIRNKISNMDEESYEKSEREETVPLLIVLVDFNDVKTTQSEEDWSEAIFGENGINSYFLENSRGEFSFVPAETGTGGAEGVLKVTLPLDRPLYEKQTDERYKSIEPGIYSGTDGRDYRLINDASLYAYAINAVDEQHEEIDFGKYEKNGDGYLDTNELAVVTIMAGYEASTLADPQGQPASWCHRWAICYFDNGDGSLDPDITQQVTLDGVGLSEHLQVGEVLDFKSSIGKEVYAQMGVFCHELAHYFGADDLYDIHYALTNRMNVYYMTLMGDGEWGYTEESPVPGSAPTHIDPLNKLAVGFCEPIKVMESGEYTLYPASSVDYNILMIDTNDENISYLIENRQSSGFDAALGYMYGEEQNGGIAVWRMNKDIIEQYWDENEINSIAEDYGFIPVFADGVYSTLPMWSTDSIDVGYYDETAFPDIQFPSEETHYNMILQAENPMIALSVDKNADNDGSVTFDVIIGDITEKPVLKNDDAFIKDGDAGSTVIFKLEQINYDDEAEWKVYSDVRTDTQAENVDVEYDSISGELRLTSSMGISAGDYWVSVKETGLYESMLTKIKVKDAVKKENSSDISSSDGYYKVKEKSKEEDIDEGTNKTADADVNKSSDGIKQVKFVDVPTDRWSAEAIGLFTEKGFISGVGNGKFEPERKISRAEFVTILAGMFKNYDIKIDDSINKFSDVSEDSWYYENVLWAVENGITCGIEDNLFEPDLEISRQDMAVMITRTVVNYGELTVVNENIEFTDYGDIADYAKDSVSLLGKAGVTYGMNDGRFAPLETVSREQAVVMLGNLLKVQLQG